MIFYGKVHKPYKIRICRAGEPHNYFEAPAPDFSQAALAPAKNMRLRLLTIGRFWQNIFSPQTANVKLEEK